MRKIDPTGQFKRDLKRRPVSQGHHRRARHLDRTIGHRPITRAPSPRPRADRRLERPSRLSCEARSRADLSQTRRRNASTRAPRPAFRTQVVTPTLAFSSHPCHILLQRSVDDRRLRMVGQRECPLIGTGQTPMTLQPNGFPFHAGCHQPRFVGAYDPACAGPSISERIS